MIGAIEAGLASAPTIKAWWPHDLSSGNSNHTALTTGPAQLAAAMVLLHQLERLNFRGEVVKAPAVTECARTLTHPSLAGHFADRDQERSAIRGMIELGRRALENRT